MDDMVTPLVDNLYPNYAEEVLYDDYICQQLRGSEIVPGDVQ